MEILLLPVIGLAQDPIREKVSLQLQWKHQFEFAGFYAAQEEGFYADAGLDVEIREYEIGKDIIGSVLSQEATFGTLYSTVIKARMEAKPVILLANYFKRSPLALVTKPDIYFPGDLRGKKVMGVEHELNSANFAPMFQQFNMGIDDFTIVPHTFSIDKFVSGEVDAMTVFLTNEVYHLRRKKVPFNIIDPNNYGVPLYDVTLFTSERFADKKPSVARAFIEASNKGWEYALANKEEIVDLILSKYNSQHKTKAHLLYEADKTQRMVLPEIYPIGSIDPVRIKKIEELFITEGVGETIVEPASFIFGSGKPQSISLTPEEKIFVREHPVIRVIKSFHQPPFTIHQENTVTGYLYDLLSQVMDIAGFSPQYVEGLQTYDAMVDAVRNGRADILPNMNSYRHLPDTISRTVPVVTTPNALVAKISTPKINETSELFGKKVAVVKGYAQDQILTKFPQIQKIHVVSNDEGFQAVRMGRADYFLNNLANSLYVIQMTFATDLRIAGELSYEAFPPLSLSFAVSQKTPELPAIIAKALAAVPLEARLDLRKKWLGEEMEDGRRTKDSRKTGIRLTAEERSYLDEKGPLAMCSPPGWPPIEWIDENGRHQGISADFINLIARLLDHKIKLVPTKTWDDTIACVKTGKCDVVSTITQPDEHSEYLNVTDVYQELDVVIATRKEQIYIQNLETLKGEKIGVVKGSAYQSIIENDLPSIEIIQLDDMAQGLRMVQSGEIIGVVDNLISLAYAIQQGTLVDIKISGRVGNAIQLRMGSRKDDPMLKQILDRALNAITPEQRKEIASKWIAVKFELGMDTTLLWKVLAITAFIILGIFAWNRKLAVYNQKILKAKEALEESKAEAEKARNEAEKANRAKSEFLANMSHELRTPLNAILGFSELMARETNLSNEQRANLEIIGRSGEHLLSLINDVLEFSKIEAGSISLFRENFDLHHLLLGLEEMFRLRAQQKGLDLVFEQYPLLPRAIRTDQMKLRQILINLLGNAINYTESGSITLSITSNRPDKGKPPGKCSLRFEVVDTGIGIPEEEQEKIFDAFFQSGDQCPSLQGTGLGLPISRKFAELMGGVLEVDSEMDTGSRFTLAIPVELVEGAPTEPSERTLKIIGLKPGQPAFRLLVAEDNDNNRNLLVQWLQKVGFELREVVNGREAIKAWREWQPHLIWMDMRMPVVDGYEATASIKSEMQNSKTGIDTKIIALTASAFKEDRQRVLEQGGDDFVSKPVREHEIFKMIEKHLGVQYIYENDDPRPLAPGNNLSDQGLAAAINDLPRALIVNLKKNLEISDAAAIDRLIDEIQAMNQPLAESLSKLAANFDYEKILALTKEISFRASDDNEEDEKGPDKD